LSEGKVLEVIVEKDLGGVFRWIVVDDFVFVDPVYLSEYMDMIDSLAMDKVLVV
jgi:hypothetical protein